MRKMHEVSLWDQAAFGPLAAVVPLVAGIAGAGAGSSALLGLGALGAGAKALLGKKSSQAASAAPVAPSAPRPAQPFSSGTSSFFGPSSSTMGGTFVTGNAGKPILGGSSGKKTLLGQ